MAVENRDFFATALTGGGNTALDTYDGDILNDGDAAKVFSGGMCYLYYLDAASGASEDSPYVIAPDTNAGTKRWVLCDIQAYAERMELVHIADPRVQDGASAPAPAATYSNGDGTVYHRAFDAAADEDVKINWQAPNNLIASAGIIYRVVGVLHAALAGATDGVCFSLSGFSMGHGDTVGGTLGSEYLSKADDMNSAQGDIIFTDLSGAVVVTGLAAGESVMFRLLRDVSDAVDDYASDFGVIGIELHWKEVLTNINF